MYFAYLKKKIFQEMPQADCAVLPKVYASVCIVDEAAVLAEHIDVRADPHKV